ncbi:MAG: biotin--[acetyl-CoA-carboxylase] ligase [Verrucomicrobia bacterium]|nr:biotin--[acetyl-CoA-carboxylase] ligase [Verrucomicrobiota bacterium]
MPTPDHLILRELLAADPSWVSGARLATKLGVSRVAVWQHMEKLRAAGFTFEAQRARGYRIAARPATPHAALIETQLKVRPRGFSLLVLDETDSTNDEAARQLGAGRSAPFAVIARRQTKGRGRLGRAWHSESNGNLYLSVAFRPRVAPERMGAFTLWMGLNVCELLANFAKVSPGLKWPNDILFDGRKAGGILTEARIDADEMRDLVFGLGLNINSPAEGWPSLLGGRAISLSEVTGTPLDFNRLAAALIGRILLAYTKFTDGDYTQTFADLWHRFDVLRGREIALLEGGRRHAGTVAGLDDEGALLLRDSRGRTQRYRAGEVTIEKTP